MIKLLRAFNSARIAAHVALAAINERIDGEGEWFRLAPTGEHPNEVGLQVVDTQSHEAMVRAFNSPVNRIAHPRGLPIYVGHPSDPAWRKANPEIYAKYPHPVGRIVAMEMRNGEAWYRPAFNAKHLDLVKGDAAVFDSQSPEWGMAEIAGRPGAYRPVLLYGIGLTNHPQISGTTIGINEAEQQTQNGETTMPTWLTQALGFKAGETFTEADVQARLQTAMNERTIAMADVKRLTDEVQTLTQRASTAEANLTTANNERQTADQARIAERAARAELVVTTAINEGRITEADRQQWVTALNTAADFAAEAGKLATLKKVSTTPQVQHLGQRKGEGNEVAQITAINEAVRAYAKENGLDLNKSEDYHAAHLGAKTKNPALFEPQAA
jgi:GTP:adenosylcobinamide-phosphate guanylyltransferase